MSEARERERVCVNFPRIGRREIELTNSSFSLTYNIQRRYPREKQQEGFTARAAVAGAGDVPRTSVKMRSSLAREKKKGKKKVFNTLQIRATSSEQISFSECVCVCFSLPPLIPRRVAPTNKNN